MASIDFSLDSRVKKCHVPLITQQRHLRHVKRIAARNLVIMSDLNCDQVLGNEIGYYFIISCLNLETLYQSEIIYSNNPCWRTFESSSFKYPSLPEIIISVYYCDSANNESMSVSSSSSSLYLSSKSKTESASKQVLKNSRSNYGHRFLEWRIHLSGLAFVGEEIPKDNRFKDNTVILGLMEGFYTSPDSIVNDDSNNFCSFSHQTMSVTESTILRNSYCLNILYRIEMMQRVISQTLCLVNNTRTKLEEKLQNMFDKSDLKSKVECMELRVKCLQNELLLRSEQFNNSCRTKARIESDIYEKVIDMSTKFQQLKLEREKLLEKRRRCDQSRERLIKTKAQSMLRKKQIISGIAKIYPLVPFPDGKGGFSICGIHLPNSEEFNGHDETMISIAIGYVTHVLIMISRMLDVPLRYQINYGNRISISDHLNDKISDSDRNFPLYPKSGKDKVHFNYGVFLVNKNIAQLRQYFGLATRDLSATLPNLYELLRERLIFSDETMAFDAIASPLLPNSSSFGQIDEIMRRELEAMKNQHELQSQPSAGPSKTHSRKLSTISNNSIKFLSESEKKSLVSRSLDKGLNEIVVHKRTSSADISNSSSVSSQTQRQFNSIPKHFINSDRIHHNFSETELQKLADNKKTINITINNHQTNSEQTDEYLNNIIYGTESTDSSPRVQTWNDMSLNSNVDQHSN